ncbi:MULTISPECIES: carotenoid oxygenase family protein [unclassified Leptolyngbya]|uniref:carotenoid oxygenase family protein n=1 Tax=unclassified Leptolyngbya TaxID=2650499 RepID=UPI0016864E2B|nr:MULTISPECIES: carotenoid oxygenase family protein [unclassified Leptolyngbya]MBD1911092.1 carotenoid oxygenase family protein [Leptolyngbya sp. FACHB-8]MBD2157074.1 carotenoid oxygenase family protein [Leptolyngbya sp. FACHB-16]
MVATLNPYLSDNFAPVGTELTVDNLPVLGEIPPELHGMFVRNGPNPQFPPLGRYHWFDGDGMLHGVHIHDGKASYRNRYIRTQGFQQEQQAGRALFGGLLEPSPQGFKNVANTALTWHGDRLLALWEGGEPHAIEVPSLDTRGTDTFKGKLASPVTAHPKVDPSTGEMMFFGYSLAQPPYVKYSIVSAEGELVRTIPIDLPVGVMMHDFAITEHYTIFMDLPLTFRLERLQRGEPAFAFERDRPSRFGILPRHGKSESIQWFEAPSCYIFHTFNAYEAGDDIVLIACRMSSTDVLGGGSPGSHEGDNRQIQADVPLPYRWQFNLKHGTVQEGPLDDRPCEFPRINEQYLGRQTRYGYVGSSAPTEVPKFDGLRKFDFQDDSAQTHAFGAGRYGGEGVFVPRPGAIAEDDGWLMTFVHDEIQNASELVIINTQAMTDAPVARILMPQRVPYGFHGTWIASV